MRSVPATMAPPSIAQILKEGAKLVEDSARLEAEILAIVGKKFG